MQHCQTCHTEPYKCVGSRNTLSYALLALRIAAGAIFIFHGYGKLFGGAPGMEVFTAMVARIGFPLPAVFAYAAAFSEFFGGLALVLGIFTRVASVFTGIVMLVALVGVKQFKLPMADADLALLAISFALFLVGPGRYTAFECAKKNGDETSV